MDKKILILEPFYTNFHNDLAKFLANDIYTLIFNLGNILYTKDAKKIFVHFEILKATINKKDIDIVQNTKTLYSEVLHKIEKREQSLEDIEYQAKYISFLRNFLQEKNIQLVIMHNDLRWQHNLGIQVCKELHIDYLVTERGLFRPHTMTVDFQGVNAYSSIVREKEFYKNIVIKEKKLNNFPIKKMINFKTNIKFIIFILLNKIGDLFKQNTIIKNKNYSLIYYTKLFIQQKLFTKKNNKQAVPEKYIFVPLQVNTDTQVLIHSDFQDIQEFISKVEKDFYALDPTIKNNLHLVFKIHPMEEGIAKYQFDSRSFVINNDTNTLIQNSEFVITINSTVGFEALQQYKKVIVLGEAFYKISDIVIPSNKQTFFKDLKETCTNNNPINQDLINNFIKYLKYTYQINGNLFNYNIKTLNAIKNKLNKRDKK